MFEDLIDQLTESDNTPADEQAIRDFNEACKRVDTDPRERQRIRDIADLVDADDLIYGQALAAIDRGDHDAAVPLLRRCAAAGIGESAWLLATVLDELGEPEAVKWYLRAAARVTSAPKQSSPNCAPGQSRHLTVPTAMLPAGSSSSTTEMPRQPSWISLRILHGQPGSSLKSHPGTLLLPPARSTDPLHRFRPNSRSLNYDAAIACLFAPLYRILWWECKSSGAASGFTTTLVDLRNELAHQRRTDTNQRAHGCFPTGRTPSHAT